MSLVTFLRGDAPPFRPNPGESVVLGRPPARQPVLASYGFDPAWPIVVSWGAGLDSTAVLAGLDELGLVPLAILFADTGDEHAATYRYIERFEREWLAPRAALGWPARVTRVGYRLGGRVISLLMHCLRTHRMPSIAYGGAKCSVKFKGDEMDRLVDRHIGPLLGAWGDGMKIVRVIGYDDSEQDRERSRSELQSRVRFLTPPTLAPEASRKEQLAAASKWRAAVRRDERLAWWYPLQHWGWNRARCFDVVSQRLPDLGPPPKSACSFCSASQPFELVELLLAEPESAWHLVLMELLAQPNARAPEPKARGGGMKKTSLGLWRSDNAGSGAGASHPAFMAEYLLEWVPSGRAFREWGEASRQKAPLGEIAALPHVGAPYRASGSAVPDPAAFAALAARAVEAGRALAARARAAGLLGPEGRVARLDRDPEAVVEAAGVAAWREARRLFAGTAADVPVARRGTITAYDQRLDAMLLDELRATGRPTEAVAEDAEDAEDGAACDAAAEPAPLAGGGVQGASDPAACAVGPSRVLVLDHAAGVRRLLAPDAAAWPLPEDLDATAPAEFEGVGAEGTLGVRYVRLGGGWARASLRADVVAALAARYDGMLVAGEGGRLHAVTAVKL